MKMRLFSALVSILVLSTASSVADSYEITIPTGYSLIANHLDNGGNTLDEVLPGVTNGTQISKYNCDGSYTTYTKGAGGWTPPGGTLKPGEGAFIINNSGAPFSLTFTGAPHVPVLPPLLPCGCGQYNLVSRQTTNNPSTFEDIMGFPPKNGTTLLKWNVSSQDFDPPNQFFFGWSNGDPSVNLGESVLIRIPACATAPVLTCATNKTVDGCLVWSFDAPTNITVNCYTNHALTFNDVTNSFNPLVATRTWTATDVCGNSNVCSQTVTVLTNCCVPLPHMLIGWWPGDEYSFDISGNGNDGMLEGDANYAGGKVAQTFCFGSSVAQVRVPDSPSLNFRTNFDFSIDAWIRTTNTSTATIVDKRSGDGSQGNTFGYSLFVLNGHLGFQLGSGPFGNFISSSPLINDNTWHFVCTTLNRLTKTGKLYVDGVLVLTFNTGAVEGDVSNSGDLLIGQRASFSTPISFEGCIDEVEIFKCPLTDAEIQSLWSAGSSGKCKVIHSICGLVFNDEDANGSEGATEPGLAGWVVQAQQSGGPLFTTTTDGDGKYCFTNLPPGTYDVSEIVQTDWALTTPGSGVYTVTLVAAQGVNGNDFGNQRTACNVPPTICCPGDIIEECTGATGTQIFFHPVAEALCDTNITVICSPPSGYAFPFGVTTVNCTATDGNGQADSCSFTVTIVDDLPPAFDCPKNMRVPCASPNGTIVTYSASATDNCDGTLPVTFTPPSGWSFPLGDTTVTCTATDSHTNTKSCCFTVTVDPLAPPPIHTMLDGGNLKVCWPATCGNFGLLESPNLGPLANWTPVAAPVVTVGGESCVTLSPTNRTAFFRLLGTAFSTETNCLLNNADFTANSPGSMPLGAAAFWSAAYGSPTVFAGQGDEDPGYIRLRGNINSGDGLQQTLQVGSQFKQGHTYKISASLRRVPGFSGDKLVRLRAIAFNGALSGQHPEAESQVAIIGLSGSILTTDWTSIDLPTWRANKDFTSIAFNVENPSSDFVTADLDNLCVAELPINAPCDDCDEAPTDAQGNVIFPDGVDISTVVYETVNLNLGKVTDLYGGTCPDAANGLATWYGSCPVPCATVGGFVPPEAFTNDFQAQLTAQGIDLTPDQIAQLLNDCQLKALEAATPDSITNFDDLCPIAGYTPPADCPNNVYTNDPFGGLDIVFVHGFDFDPLFSSITPSSPDYIHARTTWPANRDEFCEDNGYWKKRAVSNYWNDPLTDPATKGHIAHFLENKGYHNRYLVVSWSTAQRMRYGVHAVLTQISDAMNLGIGVKMLNTNDVPRTNCFGQRGYVLISHSTGAAITDAAMSLADQTKTDPHLAHTLGELGDISDHAVAHIALHGAFVGSSDATAALAIVGVGGSIKEGVVRLVDFIFNLQPTGREYHRLFGSVMVDLVPNIALLRWGPVFNRTPVPVLTVASAHWYTKYTPFMKNLIQPGFDDGVLSITSQSANWLPPFLWPSGYVPDSLPPLYPKVFDLGLGVPDDAPDKVGFSLPIPTHEGVSRGIGFYLDQWWDPSFFHLHPLIPPTYVSGACVPGVSVTGMIQPIRPFVEWDRLLALDVTAGLTWEATTVNRLSLNLDAFNVAALLGDILHTPLLRYHNHYSFLQTASSHSAPFTFDGKGEVYLVPDDHAPYLSDPPANEEVSVVTDSNLFRSHTYSPGHTVQLLRADAANLMEETVKGWRVTFRIPWTKKHVTKWIWKRTYHRAAGWDTMTECEYVYKYAVPAQ